MELRWACVSFAILCSKPIEKTREIYSPLLEVVLVVFVGSPQAAASAVKAREFKMRFMEAPVGKLDAPCMRPASARWVAQRKMLTNSLLAV